MSSKTFPQPAGSPMATGAPRRGPICIATSIHPEFDARVFRHARSVAEMGYEVDLVCSWTSGKQPLPEGLRIVPFRPLTSRRGRLFQIPARMLPLLLSRRYALYHFHDLDLLWLMAFVRLFTRRPVVYDCHENYAEEMRHRTYLPRWSRPLFAFAVKWYEQVFASIIRNVVIVVPRQLRTFAAPWFRKVMVRNFAERSLSGDRADDLAQRTPACITIASQYVHNGALLVLEVARAVARRRPDMKFFIVDRYGTDRALRARVLSEIERPDLVDRVELLPNVLPPDIMKNLNRATIGLNLGLATPNQIAALPTKLFEYMAAGLPIVASDLPNSREILADAKCGVLVPPGDVDGFADAICRIADDRALAAEMSRRGLEAFESKYTWDSEARGIGELYRSLLAADSTV